MRYKVKIEVGEVEAENEEEAKTVAQDLLLFYAESNDGSEVLANARPELELIE